MEVSSYQNAVEQLCMVLSYMEPLAWQEVEEGQLPNGDGLVCVTNPDELDRVYYNGRLIATIALGTWPGHWLAKATLFDGRTLQCTGDAYSGAHERWVYTE